MIDEIYDEFHLMNTFKVSVSRIVSSFYQSFETCLHQSRYTAAEYALFSEKIRFRLSLERSFKNSSSCATDTCSVSQSLFESSAGSILMDRYEAWNALACDIFASYRMTRSLRSDHRNIYILRRYDTSKMNVESMCEH